MPESRHIRYAEEVFAHSGAKSPALFDALATVRRENFLPQGPWLIEAANGLYYRSDDADPRHVLHAVGVALDAQRMLNNASPSKFAEQMQLVDPQAGETVFHVGAGVGYYSALFATLVGPTGHVIAAEIDEDLRNRARINLSGWDRVEVIGDALEASLPAIDILYSSAGLGILPAAWLAALRVGGRMVIPLTDGHDYGLTFLFHKTAEGRPWAAKLLSFTRHYPCHGTRDESDLAKVSTALAQGANKVTSLRLDAHEKQESCWLHGDGWCLSMQTPPA